MDERLAELEHRVAAAADAWLADPRDAGVYARLIRAIEARRSFLNPQLSTDVDDEPRPGPQRFVGGGVDQGGAGVDLSGAPVGEVDQDEVLDDLGAGHRAPARVGQDLAGDPMAALRRLRGRAGADRAELDQPQQ